MSTIMNCIKKESCVRLKVSAPGKLILFGEHSVVYGKTALAASINQRTSLELSENSDDRITIVMDKINLNLSLSFSDVMCLLKQNVPLLENKLESEFSPSSIDHDSFTCSTEERLSRLVNVSSLTNQQKSSLLVFIFLLHLIFYKNEQLLHPFSIKIDSELSLGAGTGSSASYCVCISAALLLYNSIKLTRNVSKTKFTIDELKVINSFSYAGERILHGKPSGLDNTICVNGSFVEMNRCTPNPDDSKVINVLENPPLINLLLINTGVPRNTSQLVQKVVALKTRNPSALEHILNAMDVVGKTASDLLRHIGSAQQSSLPFDEHFQRLEELIDMNQGLLYSLGVSHRCLDNICMICHEHGLNAKLTGAGGGGFAFTIFPPNFDKDKMKVCLENLKAQGYQCNHVVLGGEGVLIDFIS